MTNEAPEPNLDALLAAQQCLDWNGNLWDAILTYDRVATEAAGEAAAAQLTFEGLAVKDSVAEMKFGTSGPEAERVLHTIAESMAVMLDEYEAPNYLEIGARHKGTGKPYSMTLQRGGMPTPHEKRQEAEKALARATEQLAAQSEILARVADRRDGWAEIVANTEGNGTALQIELEHIVNTLDRALNGSQ